MAKDKQQSYKINIIIARARLTVTLDPPPTSLWTHLHHFRGELYLDAVNIDEFVRVLEGSSSVAVVKGVVKKHLSLGVVHGLGCCVGERRRGIQGSGHAL